MGYIWKEHPTKAKTTKKWKISKSKSMNRHEEDYLLNKVERIEEKVKENNRMLRQICEIINIYLANHKKENEDDFGRNVLANLISGMVDFRRIRKG